MGVLQRVSVFLSGVFCLYVVEWSGCCGLGAISGLRVVVCGVAWVAWDAYRFSVFVHKGG